MAEAKGCDGSACPAEILAFPSHGCPPALATCDMRPDRVREVEPERGSQVHMTGFVGVLRTSAVRYRISAVMGPGRRGMGRHTRLLLCNSEEGSYLIL
eukprot:353849-Chlamydomonas_euryale.AAC.1